MPHRRFVFVDETGINLDLSRTHARAPKGERAVDTSVPRNTPTHTGLVGAMGAAGMICAMQVEGAVDGAAFRVFIEECLGPHLRRGDFVVLDNLNTHNSPKVEAALYARGAFLLFLPRYSPDMNPIEGAWSKLKAHLRRVGCPHGRAPRRCPGRGPGHDQRRRRPRLVRPRRLRALKGANTHQKTALRVRPNRLELRPAGAAGNCGQPPGARSTGKSPSNTVSGCVRMLKAGVAPETSAGPADEHGLEQPADRRQERRGAQRGLLGAPAPLLPAQEGEGGADQDLALPSRAAIGSALLRSPSRSKPRT